jgi:hypothetical protein
LNWLGWATGALIVILVLASRSLLFTGSAGAVGALADVPRDVVNVVR